MAVALNQTLYFVKKKFKVQLELSKHFSEQGPIKIDGFIDIYLL